MISKKQLHQMLFYFVMLFYSLPAAAQELKPHNVIIQSSFQEESSLPPFADHTYDLLSSGKMHEPYTPQFSIATTDFPHAFSINISLSGLTLSFGEISEFFFNEQGILENAFLYFMQENYESAERKLLSLLPDDSELGEKATLLLAWTKLKKEEPDAALIYAKAGFNARSTSIAIESFYLASLILFSQQSWKEIIDIYSEQSKTHDDSFWDSRFCLIQLHALTSLQQWKAIKRFLNQIDLSRFAHSRQYYKFHEIAGIASFEEKQYEESLEHFKNAYRLFPEITFRKQLNRRIVWIEYLLGNYQIVIDRVADLQPLKLIENNDELEYLMLSSLVNTRQWHQIDAALSSISKDSAFYTYAAFKIQTHAEGASLPAETVTALKGVDYNLAEMKFRAALQSGNQAFQANRFKEAESHFLKALSADIKSDEYYMAQYNLGLTRLKQRQYAKAETDFNEVAKNAPKRQADILNYHLLYTLYQLKNTERFLTYLNRVTLPNLERSHAYETQYMHANILTTLNKNKEASDLFYHLWKQHRQLSAFEAAIHALYINRSYQAVLNLLNQHPKLFSKPLFVYEIKSLLGIQEYQQALARITKATFQGDDFVELQLEVWMANQLYSRVIDKATDLLRHNLNNQQRLLYYLSLGDAHFNLKQYAASKNQFYKALGLTTDRLKQSLIQYNIALITYYDEDYQSFLTETKIALANENLTPEIRYNLTQLLVDYYQQNNQYDKADRTLRDYVSGYQFQNVKANAKRIQLQYQNGAYQQCFQLASTIPPTEDVFQRRDRTLLLGYCGNQIDQETAVVQALNAELSKSNTPYRANEIRYVLALAQFSLGEFEKAVQLTNQMQESEIERTALIKSRLLEADAWIHLNRFEKADALLGDVNQYRQTEYYPKALRLSAEVAIAERKMDEAIRTLLRVVYLPDIEEPVRITSLLRICEIFVERNQLIEAEPYFKKIDPQQLSKGQEDFKRYQSLKMKLRSQSKSDVTEDSLD